MEKTHPFLQQIRKDVITERVVLAGIVFFSLASLSVALIGEYLLDIRPCILCLYQRIPYGVAALVAGAGVVLPISSAFRRLAVVLCGVVFAVGAGLAFYSVGVEEQWWVGVAGCEGTSLPVLSVDDLQASLARPAVLRACDEDVWRLFGLSLAAYNVAVQLVVAAACFVGLRWMVRNPRQELP